MDAQKSDVRFCHALLPNKTWISAVVILLVIAFGGVAARAQRPAPPAGPPPDTSYLGGMPSVDKVKQVIQGSNPNDTVARQVAVFNQLPLLIQQMGLAPGRRFGDTTPHEQAYLNQWATAGYQLTQDFSKSHTPAELIAFTTAHNKYESDGAFFQDMLNKLVSTQALAALAKVNKDANAAYQAHIQQEQKQNGPQTAANSNCGSIGIFDPCNFTQPSQKPLTKDQTRCLELGWSKGDCLGGTLAPIFDLALAIGQIVAAPMGGASNTPPPSPPHGFMMSGEYKMTNGLDLTFSTGGGVSLAGCGNLAAMGSGLTITPRGNGYVLELKTTPKPVELAFVPGGQITGPGTMTIDGQIITGYETHVQSRRYSDGTIVPGSNFSSTTPIYKAATATCSFGTFQLVPQTYAKQTATQFQEYGTNDLAGKPIPNGMIFSGIYASPGAQSSSGPTYAAGTVRAEFDTNNAVIDCGQAHVKAPYSVRNSGGQISIAVAMDKSPFTLTLQSNGSLSGSGATTVNGRLLAGQDASGNFNFKPVAATCNIGSLAPS
jgi:hypothetical protein